MVFLVGFIVFFSGLFQKTGVFFWLNWVQLHEP